MAIFLGSKNPLAVDLLLLVVLIQVIGYGAENSGKYPLVVSTWPFIEAVRSAWRVVDGGFSAVDAVVEGCSTCEELRCDGTGELFFVFNANDQPEDAILPVPWEGFVWHMLVDTALPYPDFFSGRGEPVMEETEREGLISYKVKANSCALFEAVSCRE